MNDRRDQALEHLTGGTAREFADCRLMLSELIDMGLSAEEVEKTLRSRPELPRELLPEEREALERIISSALPSRTREALLAQVPLVRVTGHCTCGCATVYLEVAGAKLPLAEEVESPLPINAEVVSSEGDPIGGALIFVESGKLASLEVYSHFDPISPFPAGQQLVIEHGRSS